MREGSRSAYFLSCLCQWMCVSVMGGGLSSRPDRHICTCEGGERSGENEARKGGRRERGGRRRMIGAG